MNKNPPLIKGYDRIESRKIDWLWYPYIPFGKLTIIQGDPGEGKSTFAINLVSLISRGGKIPFESISIPKYPVVYQNSEDGVADTIVPRLRACNADLSMVSYIDEMSSPFSIEADQIDEVLKNTGARLLVLDPIQAYLGDADMNRAGDIRPLFNHLAMVAEKYNCAIILIGHMSKGNGSKTLYRSLGSIDIPAVARSVLLISKVDEDTRIMVPIKNNLAPLGEAIVFNIISDFSIKWGYKVRISAEQALSGDYATLNGEGNKVFSCKNYIRFLIENGINSASEILRECKERDFSTSTIYRVKEEMRIESIKTQNGWIWRFEED